VECGLNYSGTFQKLSGHEGSVNYRISRRTQVNSVA
jgi:hypothetical protein